MISMLAVVAIAGKGGKEIEIEDEMVEKYEELCVCCGPLSKMDNNRRMLCLPPLEEELVVIEELCNEEEDLDDCITRLEADETADVASINDLKVIKEEQEEREAEHDHEHEHSDEAESGAINALSGLAAISTAFILAAF